MVPYSDEAVRLQNGVLTSIEEQLQTRCNTLQSDLQELRDSLASPSTTRSRSGYPRGPARGDRRPRKPAGRQKMAIGSGALERQRPSDIEDLRRQLDQAARRIEESDAAATAAARNTNEARREVEQMAREQPPHQRTRATRRPSPRTARSTSSPPRSGAVHRAP